MLNLMRVLKLWFGVSEPVHPAAYAFSGFTLMIVKYSVEALVIWQFTATVFWPWDFVNPLLSARAELLQPAPEWLPWALFLWTLPFLWIAVSMSVRRVADTGNSPWLGFLVLIPIINLHWATGGRTESDADRTRSAVIAVSYSLILGGLMLWLSVYVFSTYGASLFLGTPFLMSATASYFYNRAHARSYQSSIGIGLASVSVGGLAILLFALEGLVCVAMAAPLMLPIGAMGGVMGKAISDATRRPHVELVAALLLLPLAAGGEALWLDSRECVVSSTVEVNAPPSVVWQNVVSFPDLPESRPWYFRWGIACPERARIAGRGPGAVRYCEFTTGTFVEPITTWDEPRRLAFDVTDQPAPMFELSPYRHVHPPHLDGALQSTHGEFTLVLLPDGRTRLEGRTWYKLQMFPQGYWTLWSDLLIHRIHERVLLHIKRLSEEGDAPLAGTTQ